MAHTVKEVAERVGLAAGTVRYYARIGLVAPEQRTPGGYRLYSEEDEAKLSFVRQATDLGFSLEQVSELLAAADRARSEELAPDLDRLLEQKIAAIEAWIEQLRAFNERLIAYRAGPTK